MPPQGTIRTGLSHRTGSCCHFVCQKLFTDFSSHRVLAMAWSAHSKSLFMKTSDSTAQLLPQVWGMRQLDIFPGNLCMLLPQPVLVFFPIPVIYHNISWLQNLEFKDTLLPSQAVVCLTYTLYVGTSEGTKRAIWLFASGFSILGSSFAYWTVNIPKIKTCLQKVETI